MSWAAVAGAAKVVAGLAGAFGGGSKGAPSARENIMKAAQGARQAQEAYGFNPLTMLGSGAGMAGGGGGSPPPLASVQLLTEGLEGIDDVSSGDAARRRQAEQLEIDLAKLRLDQARSGVIPSQAMASETVSRTPSPIGVAHGTYAATNVRQVPPRLATASAAPASALKFEAKGKNPIAPGRKDDVAPLTNSPGVFVMQNAITGGPITIPGEGEPWGVDELATAAVIGVPQISYNVTLQQEKASREAAAEGQKKALADLERKARERNKKANPRATARRNRSDQSTTLSNF